MRNRLVAGVEGRDMTRDMTEDAEKRRGAPGAGSSWLQQHCRHHLVLWLLLALTTAMFVAAYFTSTRQPPKLIVVSVSGLRWDYLSRVPARDTPFLTGFLQNGSRVEWLEAGFLGDATSVLTSQLTGLYPSEHGVLGEHFMDPEHGEMQLDGGGARSADDAAWWGDVRPVWHRAGQQWRDAALYNLPGACVSFDDHEPRLCHARSTDRADRLAENIADALHRLRTWHFHLAVVHTDQLRRVAEQHGAESVQLLEAVRSLDADLRQLDEAVPRDINVLVVSDGGLTDTARTQELVLDAYLPEDVDVSVTGHGAHCFIYTASADVAAVQTALAAAPGLRVYARHQIPTRFRVTHAGRAPQLLVVADPDYYLETTRPLAVAAAGGYDDTEGAQSDMRGVLMGRGPSFNAGVVVPPLQAVDVHALISHLLWLSNHGSGRLRHGRQMLV